MKQNQSIMYVINNKPDNGIESISWNKSFPKLPQSVTLFKKYIYKNYYYFFKIYVINIKMEIRNIKLFIFYLLHSDCDLTSESSAASLCFKIRTKQNQKRKERERERERERKKKKII